MSTGERLPVLVGAADGMPLFRPMVWLVSVRRASNCAANTLHANLQALNLLYTWAASNGLEIERRMLDGRLLTSGELASLVRTSRHEMSATDDGSGMEVNRDTAANRVRTVADYLGWLVREGCARLDALETAARLDLCKDMLTRLRSMAPNGKGRNTVGRREGPPSEVVNALLAAIEIDAANNPWSDLGLRSRNRLLIQLFFALGLRRGEALGIRISHIDFRRSTLLVARQADSPDDPRTHQPQAKTRDRVLPLKEGLARMVEDYILCVRAKIPGARKHDYLFVSHQTGKPLSLVAVNKVFTTLRERVEGLPANLSPHVMRHAWNDAFSALMDRKQTPEAREVQIRSNLMGWSPTSKTAAEYTRRHAREESHRVSLEHQRKVVEGKPE